jgi:hypothetical protein
LFCQSDVTSFVVCRYIVDDCEGENLSDNDDDDDEDDDDDDEEEEEEDGFIVGDDYVSENEVRKSKREVCRHRYSQNVMTE